MFDHEEKLENIYKIQGILNIRVKIEPLRKTSEKIPQCQRCQGYNHTQKYCSRDPRCVKCLGKHLTIECVLNRNEAHTCVNCHGRHPANYRGCEVAKELQKIRNQKRKTDTEKLSVPNRPEGRYVPKIVKPKQQKEYQIGNDNIPRDNSYARTVTSHRSETAENDSQEVFREMMNKLNSLHNSMEEQKEANKKIYDKFTEQEGKYKQKNASKI